MGIRRSTRTTDRGDDPLVNLNARVPARLLNRVRTQCAKSEQSLRDFITLALQQHLARCTRRR